jgi:hypothetical protein
MINLRFVGAVVCFCLVGCGGGPDDVPDIAPVSGIVTVKGQPKGDLNVTFYPESGGRPASGITGPDGKFTLTTLNTGDGAPVGTNKVAITGSTADAQYGADGPPQPGQPGYEAWFGAQREKIDPKYSDPERSGLVYTVTPDGLPNVEIKLP